MSEEVLEMSVNIDEHFDISFSEGESIWSSIVGLFSI